MFCLSFLLLLIMSDRVFSTPVEMEDRFCIDSKSSLYVHRTQILGIKHLIIDYQVPEYEIKNLSKLKNLLSLKLENGFNFTSERSRRVFFVSLSKLNRLERLDISNKDFSARYLKCLPEKLKFLNVSGTTLLPSAIDYLPTSLEEIVISNTFLNTTMLVESDRFKKLTSIID
ncbi:MAG: hypothetical protein ACH349_07200 [Candidatus Rhabdochlamydia sp.]